MDGRAPRKVNRKTIFKGDDETRRRAAIGRRGIRHTGTMNRVNQTHLDAIDVVRVSYSGRYELFSGTLATIWR